MRCGKGRCKSDAVQSVMAPEQPDGLLWVCEKHYRVLAHLPAVKNHAEGDCERCRAKKATHYYGNAPTRRVCVACYNEMTRPLIPGRPMNHWPQRSSDGSIGEER